VSPTFSVTRESLSPQRSNRLCESVPLNALVTHNRTSPGWSAQPGVIVPTSFAMTRPGMQCTGVNRLSRPQDFRATGSKICPKPWRSIIRTLKKSGRIPFSK